ncbi:MAG: PilZ domain-containing protein [Planctomycetota bacterium]|jgi:c-di-GMP-binding flagellar brake protein YcgR
MNKTKERRREKRLHYELPVWFAEGSGEPSVQAVMVDISSGGMAFICDADENCPSAGQQLTMRFSVPRYGRDCSDMHEINRTGCVFRIDDLHENRRRIAVQFDDTPFWNLPPT